MDYRKLDYGRIFLEFSILSLLFAYAAKGAVPNSVVIGWFSAIFFSCISLVIYIKAMKKSKS